MSNITPLNTSIASINNFKQQVDEVGVQCLNFVISDEATAAMAGQNLSKANTLLKTIEEKIKLIRAPYNEELKKISEVGKNITGKLEEGITKLKTDIAAWETERKKKEQERERILTYIGGELKQRLQTLFDTADTKEKCTEALDYIQIKFPKDDKFGEYVKEAHALRDLYINLLETKRSGAANEAVLAKVEEMAVLAQSAKEDTSIRLQSEKTRGVRYTWTFEMDNLSCVPLEWLKLDEEKVKEYLSQNKETLKDGGVVNGVKFYKKMTISA